MAVATLPNNCSVSTLKAPTYFSDDEKGWRHYQVSDLTTASQAFYLAEESKSDACFEKIKAAGIVLLGAVGTYLTLELTMLITEVALIILLVVAAPLEAISAGVYLAAVVIGGVTIGTVVGSLILSKLWNDFAEAFAELWAHAEHLDTQAVLLTLRGLALRDQSSSAVRVENAAKDASLSGADFTKV